MSPCSDVLQGHPWLLAILHILCSLFQTPFPGTLGTAGGHGFGHIVTRTRGAEVQHSGGRRVKSGPQRSQAFCEHFTGPRKERARAAGVRIWTVELKADSHRGANRTLMGAWREVRVWSERVQREECMKLRGRGGAKGSWQQLTAPPVV